MSGAKGRSTPWLRTVRGGLRIDRVQGLWAALYITLSSHIGFYREGRSWDFVFEAKSFVSSWRFGGAKSLLLHLRRCSLCHGFPQDFP